MLCRTVRKKLKAYNDGELQGRQQRCIADHLTRCTACAAEAKHLSDAWAALEVLTDTGACPDLIDRVLTRIQEHGRQHARRIIPVPFLQLTFAHAVMCAMVVGFCTGFLGGTLYPAGTYKSVWAEALSEQEQYVDVFSELPAAFPGSMLASLGDDEGEE
ncbi:MAG: hypothetical protein N3B18_05745 [Desulfobacterota bacterium]|nr:hypothetical protein [Thermodesulfobacteriota bacterium]